MIFFVLILFGLIFWFDFIPLFKSKNIGGCVTFGIFFALSLTMAILIVFDIKIPSTMLELEKVMQSIGLSY